MIEFARHRPGTVLAWVLGLHLVVWTVLPILVCSNLQLDLIEDLALGKEWQLGYWKHPPLPWWLADLVYRLTGSVESVYLLGPLSAVVCLYAVWRLGRMVADEVTALVSVLALEGLHYFNFSVVKFAHDQLQLAFWGLTGLFAYRALERKRNLDWAAAGAFLALAFWSKYAAFALAATLGLFMLFDREARTCWRTAGPYLMALSFLAVLSPNLWWLVRHDFLPFQYVESRAVAAAHWYQYVTFPLQWTASQLFFLVPVLIMLAMLFAGRPLPSRSSAPSLAHRYVAALALGPFLVTTAAALLAGRLPVAMWGYPLWCFAPLAVLMWFKPDFQTLPFRRFAVAFVSFFIAFPAIYAAAELFEPLIRDRPKATQFPGREMAQMITERWREKTGTPLRYVGGIEVGHGPGEFAANNLVVYSPDRPHVVVHGNPLLSPWIDRADLQQRGIVLVWAGSAPTPSLPSDIQRAYPAAQLQPPLQLARKTLVPRSPVFVSYAFVLPRP